MIAGINYENTEFDYKIVFLGIGFEALFDLLNPGQGVETRSQFLENILDYFQIEPTRLEGNTFDGQMIEDFIVHQNYEVDEAMREVKL